MDIIIKTDDFTRFYAKIMDNEFVGIVRIYAHFYPICCKAENAAIFYGEVHGRLNFRFILHIKFEGIRIENEFINPRFFYVDLYVVALLFFFFGILYVVCIPQRRIYIRVIVSKHIKIVVLVEIQVVVNTFIPVNRKVVHLQESTIHLHP